MGAVVAVAGVVALTMAISPLGAPVADARGAGDDPPPLLGPLIPAPESPDDSEPGAEPGPQTPATPVVPAPAAPEWTEALPSDTRQALRTVPSTQWCEKVSCARTEVWEKVDGAWRIAIRKGEPAMFRSQVGSKGFAAVGKRRQGDLRTPSGVYGIATTFSTTDERPTAMPWRERKPTSVVSSESGRTYNTWIERRGNTYGDRRMMSWGFWIDYNNPRTNVGDTPEPVPGLGSGIFMHTSNPGEPWVATLGCVQIGKPAQMKWVVKWLDPAANPQVVNNL